MRHRRLNLLLLSGLLLINLLPQFTYHGFLLNTFNTSLPFRESYQPTILGLLYLYLLPILTGIVASFCFNSENIKNRIYYLNLSILAGLINGIPLLINSQLLGDSWFDANASGYFLMLYPCLFLGGFFIGAYKDKVSFTFSLSKYKSPERKDYLIALVFGLLVLGLNLIPFFKSNYLIGADVYYHSAMTQVVADGGSLSQNPYFLEEKNHYLSIVYYLLAFIHNHTHLSIPLIWRLFLPICSFVLIFFFYLFSRKITGSVLGAVIATILVCPLRQVLWEDPSVRNFSYAFLSASLFFLVSIMLAKKNLPKTIYSFLFSLSLVLSTTSHPEIALHIAGIFASLVVLNILSRRNWWPTFTDVKRIGFHIKSLDSYKAFGNLFLVFSLVLLSAILYSLRNYSINQILIFNEIPLSYFQPIGVISLITFLGAPFGIYALIKRRHSQDLLVLAVISLFLVTIFYFSHLWQFYHRYFAETAYFGLAVAAGLFYDKVYRNSSIKSRLLVLAAFITLLLASLLPKTILIDNYANATDASLSFEKSDFDFLRTNTRPSAVIMLDPSNIVNRHIPIYSDRYIFAGSSSISKEQQWHVLSFCGGVYEKMCDARDSLATDFFKQPTYLKLKKIRENYRVDYLLLSKQTPDEIDMFKASDLNLGSPTATNSNYALYSLGVVR